MTDEEWLNELDFIVEHMMDAADLTIAAGRFKPILRLARKGLAAEKLADALERMTFKMNQIMGEATITMRECQDSYTALAAFEAATKEEP